MLWSCSLCTFKNKADNALRCEICGTERDKSKLASDLAQKMPPTAAESPQAWVLNDASEIQREQRQQQKSQKVAQMDLFGSVTELVERKKRKKKDPTPVPIEFQQKPNKTISTVHCLESSRTVISSNIALEELRHKAKKIMREVFGIRKLRKLQPVAIECAIRRQSQIVVMATGGGKSLCYQLPATVLGGITLVISPLIALMIDQVKSLNSKGVAAALLCSVNTERENTAVMDRLVGRCVGTEKPSTDRKPSVPPPVLDPIVLLYCTPELIKTDRFRNVLRQLYGQNRIALFAVDEAHLVSTWGHEFRPSYRELSWLRSTFPNIPCMACTATATAKVIQDIRQTLLMKEDEVPCHVGSFDRPNIFYKVAFKETLNATAPGGAMGDLMNFIKRQHALAAKSGVPCSGIVYVHTRNDTAFLASKITAGTGVRAAPYHAGLKDNERGQIQQQWMSGEIQVAVATVALGMGIDLPHIRYVIHWSLAKSLEGFYQESGRAGRDGLPAHSVLYYAKADASLFSFLIQKQRDSSRALDALQKMVDYCTTACCRRQFILRHFGEEADSSSCVKTCDYCKDPKRVERAISTSQVITDVMANGKGAHHRKQHSSKTTDGQWDRPHGCDDEDELDKSSFRHTKQARKHVLDETCASAESLDDFDDMVAPRLPKKQGFVKASSILSKYEKLESLESLRNGKKKGKDKQHQAAPSSDTVNIPDHLRAKMPDPLQRFSYAAKKETSADISAKANELGAKLAKLKAEQAARLQAFQKRSSQSATSLPPPPPPPLNPHRSMKKHR